MKRLLVKNAVRLTGVRDHPHSRHCFTMHSDCFEQLRSACFQLEKSFSKFDFDSESRGNGVRSFVSIVSKYCDIVKSLRTGDDRIPDYNTIGNTLLRVQNLMQQAVQRNTDYAALTETDLQILSESFSFTKSDVQPIFGQIGPFWLKEYFRTKGLVTPGLASSVMGHIIAKAGEIREKEKNWIFPVNIQRSGSWVLGAEDPNSPVTLRHVPNPVITDPGDVIECLIFKPKVTMYPNSLIMHQHGGGFVAMSPNEFVPLLHRWSNELGVTVLCANYAKAPGNKYPAGLQDILHAYLFLTSGRHEARQMLGFHPSRVILTGDSAGGNLSTGLTIALSQINKSERAKVQMPQAVALQYPWSSPCWIAYPSQLLANLDTLITAPGYATLVPAYVPTTPPVELQWFRKPDRHEVMRRMAGRMSDPLLNNLAFRDWHDFKNIPLHMLVCEFDPLLDHGVALAKKWRDGGASVSVQVCEEMPHGCLMTTDDGEIAAESETLVQRLRQLLNNNSTSSRL